MVEDVAYKDVGNSANRTGGVCSIVAGARYGVVRRDDMDFSLRMLEAQTPPRYNRDWISFVVHPLEIRYLRNPKN